MYLAVTTEIDILYNSSIKCFIPKKSLSSQTAINDINDKSKPKPWSVLVFLTVFSFQPIKMCFVCIISGH